MKIQYFILVSGAILFVFLICCSSDTEGDKGNGTGTDTGIRTCKNSAQCKPDEECANNVCVKKTPKDAEATDISDIYADIKADIDTDAEVQDIYDAGIDAGDITDASDISDAETGYRIGIMSVYEGAAGECINEEYRLRSVSGYSGVTDMRNEEYTVRSGAKFR
ncbi:MAG: hypothetical protein N3B13_01405 [Deltaproteobacteria bacterium]|nr:hypothetical protein [Deltaproteobacteria bacterium]